MAELFILSWRDIPAQVVVKHGRAVAKRELSKRFLEAIDRAAMREGLKDGDDYLAQWRRSEPTPCGDDLEAEATGAAERIEQAYDGKMLAELSAAGGRKG